LAECAPWLEEYGGHKLAAGVSLRQDQFEGFGRAFEQVCARRLADADLRPVQTVDAWLTHLGEADECLLTAVERLEPFGSGNPTPLWGMRGVTVLGEPRRVGRDGAHLKMTVACGGAQRDTIGFGLGAREVPPAALDILFEVDRNEYAGRSSIQLRVRDFRPAAGPF
jgi:single-stranded-DNA-specific exonuclease